MGKKTIDGEMILFWIILDFESRILTVKVYMETVKVFCYFFIQFYF